jgi:hypothetical protein
MAKKKKNKDYFCCFLWYDKKSKSMKQCGTKAIMLYNGNPLCEECAKGIDKSHTMIQLL